MKRRSFLSLFLIGNVSLMAEDGLLFDAPQKTSGMLLDVDEAEGFLFDIPKEVLESQKLIAVHLYSPTWKCPPCELAIKELKDHPGIKLIVHKQDEPPEYFKGKSWPILHWGEGDKWQSGWHGKYKFLSKLLGDESQPPDAKPITVKDSHASHWSVSGDWNASEQKIEDHLVHVHGFKRDRIIHLNRGQLLTLHDLAHEGGINRTKQVSQSQQRLEDYPT